MSKSALAVTLSEKRALIKTLKAEVQGLAAQYKLERANKKASKVEAREARKVTAIAKAKAKLEKLMAPVGSKAIKANRKPSKAQVTKVAA
jgi:hypothetical protein